MAISNIIPDISISLISTNERSHLEKLLPSLLLATGQSNAEILLVDNQSTDGTSEYIRSYYPQLKVILNTARLGYGKNHNINLQNARGRYFVIMNSDMVVPQDIFVRLMGFMEENPDIGMCSPKILNEDGTIQGLNKRYPTVLDLFLRRFWPKSLTRFVQQRLDYYEMRDIGYDQIIDVQSLSGSFMFCRTDLIRSLGGFDPKYLLYFEDTDLCRRFQKTHRTMYYPFTSVVHYWQRSSHKNWTWTWVFMKSAARYFWTWGIKLW